MAFWPGKQLGNPPTLYSFDPVGPLSQSGYTCLILATEGHVAELTTIKDLLEEEIKDLYSAEKQLTKALPKLAKGANNQELVRTIEQHLAETEDQAKRLERAAKALGITPAGKKCAGMEGLIEEGSEVLGQHGQEIVQDLAIIGAAARVEHYEIAAYMTAIALAEQIEEPEVIKALNESLAEEQAAENKLRSIAKTIIKTAPAEQEKKKRASA
jgi:ferritin-like metal-binding protein YciE